MSSSAESALRDGIDVRGKWGRREFVPFDEIDALDATTITLASGQTHRLAARELEDARSALSPPLPSEEEAADAHGWRAYLGGPWSPVRAAESLVAIASHHGASDVHIEPHPDGFAVRLRGAGVLRGFCELDSRVGRRLIAALKHLAACLPYRSDVVQEGRIPRSGVAADVRASFMPTALGERVALRLFGTLLTMEDLRLPVDVAEGVRGLLEATAGLLLIAGPSGGGKTTTVYAALGWLAQRRHGAHLSIEDPVEHRLRLAGIPVDQVELAPERGLTAESVLAGALRQDIDVIALAEIRSEAEATLALRAAHTGRLVIAGVHAGSPEEARRRMLDLGAEPSVLDATLLGVLHQRLVADAEGSRRPAATLWVRGDS